MNATVQSSILNLYSANGCFYTAPGVPDGLVLLKKKLTVLSLEFHLFCYTVLFIDKINQFRRNISYFNQITTIQQQSLFDE